MVDASQRTVFRHIVNRPLVDEMLRDRLVAGIRDKPLSDKLQMKADLTLESAKKAIRQREAVREQRHELGNDSRKGHPAVEDVTRRFNPKPPRDRGGVSRNSTPHIKGKRQNHRDMGCRLCQN